LSEKIIEEDTAPVSSLSISITSFDSKGITLQGIATFLSCFEEAKIVTKLSLNLSGNNQERIQSLSYDDLFLYFARKQKDIVFENLNLCCDDKTEVSLEPFLENSQKLFTKYLRLDLKQRNFEEATSFAEIFHLIEAEEVTEIKFSSEINFEKDYDDSMWDDFDSDIHSVEERNCLDAFVGPLLQKKTQSKIVRFDFSGTIMSSHNYSKLSDILKGNKSKIEKLEIKVGMPDAEEVDEFYFGLEMELFEAILKLSCNLKKVIGFEVDLNELITFGEEKEKPKFKIDQKQAKKSQLEHITLNLEKCDIRAPLLRTMIEPFKYFPKIKDITIKCSKKVDELYNHKNVLKSSQGRVIPCNFIIKN